MSRFELRRQQARENGFDITSDDVPLRARWRGPGKPVEIYRLPTQDRVAQLDTSFLDSENAVNPTSTEAARRIADIFFAECPA